MTVFKIVHEPPDENVCRYLEGLVQCLNEAYGRDWDALDLGRVVHADLVDWNITRHDLDASGLTPGAAVELRRLLGEEAGG